MMHKIILMLIVIIYIYMKQICLKCETIKCLLVGFFV